MLICSEIVVCEMVVVVLLLGYLFVLCVVIVFGELVGE